MKIVSEYKELEGQVFNTVKECETAEHKVDEQRKALSKKEKDMSKLKKSLAAQVDKAEEDLKAAYQNYDEAKETAKKIVEEANKLISETLQPAKKAVRDAEAARTEAIINYNKQCGPYQKVYTGDKAKEEYLRMTEQIDSVFNSIWKNFFNFNI